MGPPPAPPPPPAPLTNCPHPATALPPGLRLRPPTPADAAALRAAHAALFPVDYEDAFYDAVLASSGGVFGLVAESVERGGVVVEKSSSSSPPTIIAGFVTARLQDAADVDAHDAAALGLPPRPAAAPPPRGPGGGLSGPPPVRPDAIYLLTLGVSPSFRRRGLARALVAAALARGAAAGCRVAYLHAATFNAEAAGLYARAGFSRLATFPAFYTIATGRQPDPAVTRYDAVLLATELVVVEGGGGGDTSALAQWRLPVGPAGAPPPTPRVSTCATPPRQTHTSTLNALTAWLTWAVSSLVAALTPARPPPAWAARLVARGRRLQPAASPAEEAC